MEDEAPPANVKLEALADAAKKVQLKRWTKLSTTNVGRKCFVSDHTRVGVSATRTLSQSPSLRGRHDKAEEAVACREAVQHVSTPR
jgi:hypothetical protein